MSVSSPLTLRVAGDADEPESHEEGDVDHVDDKDGGRSQHPDLRQGYQGHPNQRQPHWLADLVVVISKDTVPAGGNQTTESQNAREEKGRERELTEM